MSQPAQGATAEAPARLRWGQMRIAPELSHFSREGQCITHAFSGLGGACSVNGNVIHPITGAILGQTPRRRPATNPQVQTGTPPAVAPCPFYPHISCLFALTFPSQAARSTSKIRVVPACSLE